MINTFLTQASWVPQDVKKVVGEWVATCSPRRSSRALVDENFRRMEDVFQPRTNCRKSPSSSNRALFPQRSGGNMNDVKDAVDAGFERYLTFLKGLEAVGMSWKRCRGDPEKDQGQRDLLQRHIQVYQ